MVVASRLHNVNPRGFHVVMIAAVLFLVPVYLSIDGFSRENLIKMTKSWWNRKRNSHDKWSSVYDVTQNVNFLESSISGFILPTFYEQLMYWSFLVTSSVTSFKDNPYRLRNFKFESGANERWKYVTILKINIASTGFPRNSQSCRIRTANIRTPVFRLNISPPPPIGIWSSQLFWILGPRITRGTCIMLISIFCSFSKYCPTCIFVNKL